MTDEEEERTGQGARRNRGRRRPARNPTQQLPFSEEERGSPAGQGVLGQDATGGDEETAKPFLVRGHELGETIVDGRLPNEVIDVANGIQNGGDGGDREEETNVINQRNISGAPNSGGREGIDTGSESPPIYGKMTESDPTNPGETVEEVKARSSAPPRSDGEETGGEHQELFRVVENLMDSGFDGVPPLDPGDERGDDEVSDDDVEAAFTETGSGLPPAILHQETGADDGGTDSDRGTAFENEDTEAVPNPLSASREEMARTVPLGEAASDEGRKKEDLGISAAEFERYGDIYYAIKRAYVASGNGVPEEKVPLQEKLEKAIEYATELEDAGGWAAAMRMSAFRRAFFGTEERDATRSLDDYNKWLETERKTMEGASQALLDAGITPGQYGRRGTINALVASSMGGGKRGELLRRFADKISAGGEFERIDEDDPVAIVERENRTRVAETRFEAMVEIASQEIQERIKKAERTISVLRLKEVVGGEKREDGEQEKEKPNPRRGFLWAAGIAGVAAAIGHVANYLGILKWGKKKESVPEKVAASGAKPAVPGSGRKPREGVSRRDFLRGRSSKKAAEASKKSEQAVPQKRAAPAAAVNPMDELERQIKERCSKRKRLFGGRKAAEAAYRSVMDQLDGSVMPSDADAWGKLMIQTEFPDPYFRILVLSDIVRGWWTDNGTSAETAYVALKILEGMVAEISAFPKFWGSLKKNIKQGVIPRPEIEEVDDYGADVREAREKAGESCESLAAKIGIDAGLLEKIENGEVVPPSEIEKVLEKELGVKRFKMGYLEAMAQMDYVGTQRCTAASLWEDIVDVGENIWKKVTGGDRNKAAEFDEKCARVAGGARAWGKIKKTAKRMGEHARNQMRKAECRVSRPEEAVSVSIERSVRSLFLSEQHRAQKKTEKDLIKNFGRAKGTTFPPPKPKKLDANPFSSGGGRGKKKGKTSWKGISDLFKRSASNAELPGDGGLPLPTQFRTRMGARKLPKGRKPELPQVSGNNPATMRVRFG